ncbi:MAG TPA: sigma-70 family RNA polymerase sigma factor, partial [Candidatus Hydrogenedentes bacterium]|nr:sigma-70 family RNA polymerase sigma factor [Candidatus Hydrogenedentota bacterium]
MSGSDTVLLRRWAATRDADAFAEIVSRHSGMVYGTCKRMLGNASEAEDVAQECFIELVQAPAAVKRSLPGWLHATAIHRSLDRVKCEKRRRGREARFAANMAAKTELVWNDVREHVDDAIAHLPEKLRAPIILRFLEGQTHETIARHLAVPRTTVQYRLDKGIDEIRSFLKRRGVSLAAAALASMMGANLAEAAPAALTAELGRVALAGARGVSSAAASSTLTQAAVLGGILAMKKVFFGIAVALAAILSLWAITRNDQPDPAQRPHLPELAESLVETRSLDSIKRETPVGERESAVAHEPAPAAAPQGSVITGRVYDADTGEGIAGVAVTAKSSKMDGNTGTGAPTDASGAYRIAGLRGTQYRLSRTTPEGYRRPHFGDGPEIVSLEPGDVVENVDFALRREVPLAGIVVDQRQQPVQGALVILYGGLVGGGTTQSGGDGSLSFHGLHPSDGFYLEARKDDSFVSEAQAFALPEEGITDIILVLGAACSVSGTVLDIEGRPVKDIEVRSKPVRDGVVGVGGPRAVSDARGRYTLDGLGPGRYDLNLPEWGSPAESEGRQAMASVELESGDVITDLALLYKEEELAISGRVVDSDGQPVQGAIVQAGRTEAKTDEDGAYEITGLAEGNYYMFVRPGKLPVIGTRNGLALFQTSFFLTRENVATGRSDVGFVVQKPFAVTGEVVNALTGKPIAEFEIACDQTLGSQLTSSVAARFDRVKDSQGRFRIEQIQDGPYLVAVRAPGYATALHSLYLGGEQREHHVVIRLEQGGDLRGTVVNATGEPIQGAEVFLGPVMGAAARTPSYFTTMSGADGTFMLESFPKEAQLISAS